MPRHSPAPGPVGPTAASLALLRALTLALTLAPLAAAAQYKIVGPGDRITYTDRPPPGAAPIDRLPPGAAPLSGSTRAASAAAPALPYAVAQVAARHPVTLYTTPDCAPCDAARQALRQRGVPHRELRVARDGADALQQREGTRELPLLRIGAQQLVGWQPQTWRAYLDAAGYPRDSALPTGYRWPEPQPLVAAAPAAPAPTPPPAPSLPPAPLPPVGAASGFRF